MTDGPSFTPPPPPVFPTTPIPPPPTPPQRSGPPWEQPGPFLQRFVDTLRGVLLDPTNFFRTMRREGGIVQPFTFYLVCGAVVLAMSLFWNLAGFGMGSFGGRGDFGPAAGAGLLTGVIGLLIFGCIFLVIGTFIWAGILHVCLMLIGGQKYSFEATFRVVCYASGGPSLWSIVPMCGGIIGGIWSIVATIIGLAEVHETTTGKAAVAVLLPLIACCVFVAIVAMLVGVSFARMMQGGGGY